VNARQKAVAGSAIHQMASFLEGSALELLSLPNLFPIDGNVARRLNR
jgi:hypothetical protein